MLVSHVPASRAPQARSAPVGADPTYPLTADRHELDRLDRQGRALAPSTHLVLESAGLREGMRVLDLGSGAGDTAIAAARIVGPTGQVVGLDRSAAALARATERAAACGLDNVTFRAGDMGEVQGRAGTFDAVIGRLVLMYSSDPAAVLRRQAVSLAPGGLVVAIEFDVHSCRSLPSTPLVEQLVEMGARTFELAGVDVALGPKLWQVMSDAGLTPRGMVAVQPHFGPADPEGAGLLAGILRSAAPLIERTGVARVEDLGLDTYESRLRAQLVQADAVVGYPTLYGAWATV